MSFSLKVYPNIATKSAHAMALLSSSLLAHLDHALRMSPHSMAAIVVSFSGHDWLVAKLAMERVA